MSYGLLIKTNQYLIIPSILMAIKSAYARLSCRSPALPNDWHSGLKCEITRWVDGTPTTEVTPVTTWQIHTPDLGHQMVMIMVMNDLLPPPLCNVNQPSHSEIQLFQHLTLKIHGQGHLCGKRSRSHLTFKIQRSMLWSSSNPLVTFEAWSSIDMFAFRFEAIWPFLAEI